MEKKAIEELGITRELFESLYIENEGFDNCFNKNHPSYSGDESYGQFLMSGVTLLSAEHEDIIKNIVD